MKNKGYIIFKSVALTIAIIIPLLVAFLMCRYTYNRHIDNFDNTYFASIKYDRKGNDKENYKEQIEALLQYTSYQYRLFKTEEIKYDDTRSLATLDIYEVVERNEITDNNDNVSYTYEIYYYFLLHNVNYGSMYRLSEASEDVEIPSTGAIPSVYMQIRNADNYTNDDEATNYEFNAEDFLKFVFVDYGSTPAKVGKQYLLALKIGASELPSKNITVAIHCDDTKASGHTEVPNENKTRYVYSKDNNLSVDYFYVDLTEADLQTFTVGFNNDYKAAGYTKFIFKTYWWWEALITLVLVGALTGIFYMVLTYREEEK